MTTSTDTERDDLTPTPGNTPPGIEQVLARLDQLARVVGAQSTVVYELSLNLRLHGQYVQKMAEVHGLKTRLEELDEQVGVRVEALKESVGAMLDATTAMESAE